MKDNLAMLGFKVKDCVTGFTGVVTSISFDLYGCIMAIVTPEAKADFKDDSRWFDVKRLTTIGAMPIMPVPTFDELSTVAGPQDKPSRRG